MSIIAASIFIVFTGQTAVVDTLRDEQARLNACIERTLSEPIEAYEDSLAWLNEGARPAAQYCSALALAALGKNREAAARLETLANLEGSGTLATRAVYLTQAGNAWLAAGLPDEAIVTLTNALKLSRTDPALYKDRAAAFILAERWRESLSDLNEALTLNPADAEAYRLRALAYLQQNQPEYALTDIETSLRYDGENIETLLLRGEVNEAIRLKTGQ